MLSCSHTYVGTYLCKRTHALALAERLRNVKGVGLRAPTARFLFVLADERSAKNHIRRVRARVYHLATQSEMLCITFPSRARNSPC